MAFEYSRYIQDAIKLEFSFYIYPLHVDSMERAYNTIYTVNAHVKKNACDYLLVVYPF